MKREGAIKICAGRPAVVPQDGCYTLGDGSHGQCHGDLEVVDSSSDPGTSVNRVIEVSDVNDPHSDADQ